MHQKQVPIIKRIQTTVLAALLVLWSWSTALALTFTDDATGGDCTAVGNWDAATRTCTLTQDIATAVSGNAVEVTDPDITLDCDGHTITGNGSFSRGNNGVRVRADNITVTRCEVSSFRNAIFATSQSNTLTRNTIHDVRSGILISGGAGGFIMDNIVRSYFLRGVSIFSGSNITISNNVVDGGAVPKAAFETGIRVFSGSENQILTNTILNSVIPISVISSNGNNISGNTVDTGFFGIDVEGDSTEITDNDITEQGVFAIFIAGSFNTIADNDIYESAGIRVEFFDQVGPSNNNVVEGNIIEDGNGNISCDGNPVCDNGILLTAKRAQIEFNNAFGDGFLDNNIITGNTIRNMPGVGIDFDNAGTNNVVSNNIITENARGGILLAHRCPTCEYKFMRNDIFNNGGTPLVSVDSETDQNFVRTLLGPLAVDIAGDDGLGNPIGNYWGRNCGKGPNGPPLFQPGVDSNALDVVDSFPFRHPVANIPVTKPLKLKVCPSL